MRRASICGVLLALVLAPVATLARPARSPGPAPARPVAAAGVSGGLSTEGVTTSQRLALAIAQLHMSTCAGPLQRVADFLLEGQEGAFTLQPLGPDTDRWPVVMTLESAHPALGRTRFSTVVASPGVRCSGMYQQTIYWPQPCDALRRSVFASFHGEHALLKDVQASEANAGLQLYLTPAGAGCLSVKKELFH